MTSTLTARICLRNFFNTDWAMLRIDSFWVFQVVAIQVQGAIVTTRQGKVVANYGGTPPVQRRQNAGEISTSSGKTSRRPSSMATRQIHLPASDSVAKFDATLPNPVPVLFMQAAMAENAVIWSSPIAISSTISRPNDTT